MPTPGASDPELQKPLDQFRARTKRLTIHPLELAAAWVIGGHLAILPWALGTMRPPAQWTSLGLSLVGFGLALLPRNYREEHAHSAGFRLVMWPKLFRFPIFWIGLALLALVTVQALNPAWRYQANKEWWWITPIPHNSSLPPGVEAPFALYNPWRMLLIYTSAWLTICSIWVAFTRRRTVQLLLIGLAINGILLASLGIAQRLLGNGKIYWFIESPNSYFFASFIYKNHGAAYLLLTLAVTCGLAAWYYLRGIRRMEKSNPSGVLAFFATCIGIGILTSYARGVTIITLVFLLACIAAFITHQFRTESEHRKPIVAVALLLIFGFFLKTGLEAVRSHEAWNRLRQGVMREDVSLELRERANALSFQMLHENWKAGVGAGAFRFHFPTYQGRPPEFRYWNGRAMFWEHAHNDVVQFPIELGAIGSALIVAGFIWWVLALTRAYFWSTPLSACLVLCLLLMLVYCWWDFPFQCPAILTTWCALWALATMWAQFEESGAKS